MALIFTDVDGTLLDESGRFAVPEPAWRRAITSHVIVPASSRDVGELADLQQELGLAGPLIAEDGAVLVGATGDVTVLGQPRRVLLERLVEALGPAEASQLLAGEPAAARGRLGSILLPVAVVEASRSARLTARGLDLTPGGRWATVTAGSDKGRAARELAASLGFAEWLAIGNAANDRRLLASATRGFVIHNPDGYDPALTSLPGVTLLQAHGPEGWPEAIPQD